MAKESESYEKVPYIGRMHAQSHVDALATVATLFGVTPQSPESCRVLELGCADGTNITGMAFNLPNSQFVGIDGSETQIEAGRGIIADLGLTNVTLHCQDLRNIGPELGKFDYIIAHGIFSWIAQDARCALLKICRDMMQPNGIAYISYNCYPGWHRYEQLRGMMKFHSRGMETVKEEIEQARAIVQFVGNAIVDSESTRAEFFKQIMPDVLRMSSDYLFHEYLEANNQPMYFHEFIEMAKTHDLQYLGESLFHTMMSSNYPESVKETMNRISHNIIELEQYMDFVRDRRFRCTLLCHAEIELERSISLNHILNFKVGFPFRNEETREDGGTRFINVRNTDIEVIAKEELHKVALAHLSENWPRCLPFSEVVAHCEKTANINPTPQAQTELADLFMTLYTQSFMEFHVFEAPINPTIDEKPIVSRLVRYQARNGRVVGSQKHDMFSLDDVLIRLLLERLDGTHNLDQVTDALLPKISKETRAQWDDPRQSLRTLIEECFQRLAAESVLIPSNAISSIG